MEPVPIVVGPETRWAPTPELLDAAGPLDGLVVASPSNPTGTVLDAERARAARAPLRRAAASRLVADEIYHGITYGGPAPTLLAAHRRAIVVNSFSKYFSMTGWRLGWVVMPDDLAGSIERLQQNLYICAPHVSQVAALGALDCDRRARRPRRALPGQPRRAASTVSLAPASTASPTPTARSTSTPTCLTSPPTSHRLAHALPPLARRARRRDDSGHRLRPRSGRPVRALLVRRRDDRRSPVPVSSSPVGRPERIVDTPSRATARGAPRPRPVDRDRRSELRPLPRRLRRRRHQGRAPRRRHPAPPGVARPARRRRPVVEARQPQQAHDRPRPQGSTTDRDVLLALVDDADVLVENFRPGTLERLGLAPDTLLDAQPAAGDHAGHRFRPGRAVREPARLRHRRRGRCRGSRR